MITLHTKEPGVHLARRVAELRKGLRSRDVAELADKAGAVLANGRFHLYLWGQPVTISPPDFLAYTEAGEELDIFSQALLAYYLHTTNGAPLTGEWIAFTELPDAQFYTTAFQGYTGNELAKVFGNDIERLAETAVAIGGWAVQFADRAVAFQVLPRVVIMVACWSGDEEFPPSYRILFDANTRYQLPTDACAIIGSTLTQQLVKRYNLAK